VSDGKPIILKEENSHETVLFSGRLLALAHIALLEAVAYDLVKVDVAPRSSRTATTTTRSIRRPGAGAGLDSVSHDEGPVIVQMIATRPPQRTWHGPRQRRALQAAGMAQFHTTELHKNFSPLFNPAIRRGQGLLQGRIHGQVNTPTRSSPADY